MAKNSPLKIANMMADAAHKKAQPKPSDESAQDEAMEEQISPGIHDKVKQKEAGAIAEKKKGKAPQFTKKA